MSSLADDVVGALPHVPGLLVSLVLRGHELMQSSVAAGSLERGHQGPLLVGGVRRVLVVVEIGEVIVIIVDLVGHLAIGRVEDLRVRLPCNRPPWQTV
jgi:hypothetical protein